MASPMPEYSQPSYLPIRMDVILSEVVIDVWQYFFTVSIINDIGTWNIKDAGG